MEALLEVVPDSMRQWFPGLDSLGLESPRIAIILTSLVLIPVTYVCYLIAHTYLEARKLHKVIDKLPGRPCHPIWGNLLEFQGGPEAQIGHMHEMMNEHGCRRIWRLWFGPFVAFVVLCHPDTIKLFLKSTQPKITKHNRMSGYNMILPWLGEGLLVSGGAKWARNRRLLTPAFHFDILKGYMEVYNKAANIMLNNMLLKSGGGKSVEMFESVSMCTLDIILKCAFSYNLDVQNPVEQNPYVKTVNTLSDLLLVRAFNPILRLSDTLWHLSSAGRRSKHQCDLAHKVAEDIIKKRRQALADDPSAVQKRYLDFLDILLSARDEDGQGLTDLEIRNEVDTFLFEGHDTTASAISWTLYSFAKHPEFQEKARKEIDDVLQGRDADDFVWDDLVRLPYLTQCIKEAMRLWSPVPVIGRQLESQVEVDGVLLPPGTPLDINIYAVHHNPDVWGDDHMEYKPDRMHIDNTKNMDSFAFIPFSAGPRNCIGQSFAMNEEKIVIAKVLRRFVLATDPSHTPIPAPTVVMRAVDGIRLKITPRQT